MTIVCANLNTLYIQEDTLLRHDFKLKQLQKKRILKLKSIYLSNFRILLIIYPFCRACPFMKKMSD